MHSTVQYRQYRASASGTELEINTRSVDGTVQYYIKSMVSTSIEKFDFLSGFQAKNLSVDSPV